MWYFLASFLILLACGAASIGAGSFSYLAENVSLTHGLLSALCLVFLLLGVVIAVLANTDAKGQIHSPQTLSALMCLIFLVPQGGLAIGMLVNYKSHLEIMTAVKYSAGTSVYADQGFAVLDGEIGHETLSTLRNVVDYERISILFLRSEGGLIEIGIEIGKLLKLNRMAVFVPENCESACVIIALSGEQLYVAPDARFGFHRGSAVASNNSQLGRFIGNAATEDYVLALGALGVPESILAITRATPSNDMHYLSGDEMISIGLARDQSEYRR
jgi:hypothetical protein